MRSLIAVGALVLASAASALTTSSEYPPVPASCGTVGQSGQGGDFCNYTATQPFWEYPANPLPDVWTEAPVTIKQVKNGIRQLGGTGNDTFYIAHLYSDTDNMTEMGYALGQMYPKELSDMLADFEENVSKWVDKANLKDLLPVWLVDLVLSKGVGVALDVIYDITEKYIPQDVKDEWEGMVAGCNSQPGGKCSLKSFRHLLLIPQLTKAACTIFTAHNDATKNGHALHLRALDFECKTGVADWSSITIYHFKNKPMYANYLFLGLQGGTFTAMSYNPKTDAVMTVSEKKWGGKSAALPWGLPWMTMLREAVLKSGPEEVTQYIEGVSKATSPTPNTVSIHAGFTFGTYGKPNGATDDSIAFEVGYNYSKKFKWNTQSTDGDKTPQLKDQIYFLKNSGPHTECAREMMLGNPATNSTGMYGKYTADYFARYWTSADMTGDTQIVGWDLTELKAIIAYSRKTTVQSGTCCAYHRIRTEVDMKAMFDLPAPTGL